MLAIVASLLITQAPAPAKAPAPAPAAPAPAAPAPVVEPPKVPPPTLLTPEALVTEGFRRSRIVIINEAHDANLRNVNTRAVVMRTLESARKAGATHFAVEALPAGGFAEQVNRTKELPPATAGYLAQPEMRSLLTAAIFMGFTLVSYDQPPTGAPADLRTATPEQRLALANARDEQQADTLAKVFAKLPPGAKLFVLCSNSHVYETTEQGWTFMASRLKKKTLVDPFTIDQTRALRWNTGGGAVSPVITWLKPQLDKLPLNAGGFYAGAPGNKRYDKEAGADAYIVSTNDLLE